MHVASGSFAGNGSSQSITGLGFQPSFVLLHTVNQNMVWTSSAMGANSSKSMGTGALFSGAITSLDSDGFSVGSSALANGNGATVYYTALGGSLNIDVGSYTGNGVDDRNISVAIDPDFVWVWRDSDNPEFRVTSYASSLIFENVFSDALVDNAIQALGTGSFQVGTHQHVNSNGVTYYYLAVQRETGRFIDLTYTGNGADSRSITGFGFQPTLGFVLRGWPGTGRSCIRYGSQVGDVSFEVGGNSGNNRIQAFESDGIQVGTDLRANANTDTYIAWAFADGLEAPTGPVIDSVTPSAVHDGTTVVIAGENFGASQGTGKVEIGDDSDYAMANLEEATVSAWADDEITADIVQGGLANGPVWLFVTDDDGNTSAGFAMTLGLLDFSLEGTIDFEIELSSPARTRLAIVGTLDLEIDFAELPLPPVLEFQFTGSIDMAIEQEVQVRAFARHRPGVSTVTVYRPGGAVAGTLTPLRYRMSRYENQVGYWECDVPVDEAITDGVPLASLITYGWKISIQQENFNPDHAPEEGFLLYQGIVETRAHSISEGGQTMLAMTGSFRTYELVRRSVFRVWEFSGTLKSLTDSLTSGIISPIYDAAKLSRVRVAGTFTHLSKYAAWARGAALGRYVIRETWDHDLPEIVPYDGPPNSGITFRPLNPDEDRYLHENGGSGVALIAGKPIVKFDGAGVVNRIVALGVDTVTDPEDPEGTVSATLTLQHASLSSPYTVKAGANQNGSLYYYIEDAASIAAYGVTEVVLTFGEVRNPNNLTESRRLAANVLYMKAVNEMIRRRSEILDVTLNPIANGAQIWALPGDQTVLEYYGEVLTESGAAVWMDLDKRMLITERHEESHPSGVRRVSYKLMAPVMEFPVPGLPGEISLPPESPCEIADSSDPEPSTPDCPSPLPPETDPPGTDENEGPDDEWEENFPTPEGAYGIWVRDPLGFVVPGGSVNSVPWNRRSSGTLEPDGGWNIYTLPDLGPGSFSVSGQVLINVSAFERDGDWTVRLVIDGVPGDPLLAGSITSFVPAGGNNTDEGVVPNVVANGLSAGDTVWMEVIAPAGPSIAATMEGHITITFTPTP